MPMNLALVIFEFVVMLLAISLHDCAQAWTANRLGDATARLAGRLTMNPVPHFDLFGTAIWPLLYIFRSPIILGWGKPVPMTYRNFRRRNGELLATLAGPAAQLLAAVVCLVALIVLKHTVPGTTASLSAAELLANRIPLDISGAPGMFPVLLLLYICIFVNVLLFAFNILPIPFCDGGKILASLLPYNAAKSFEQYGLWIMIAFFFVGYYVIMLIFQPILAVFNAFLNAL